MIPLLRGDHILVGNDYLILFRHGIFGELLPVARNGAVIPYDSDEFHEFQKVITFVSEEIEN